MVTLAFVLTLVSLEFRNRYQVFNKFLQIENNLDEWITGEHVDVPFTTTAYKAKYRAHLLFITDFEKKTRDADIIPRLLKHMLKVARYVHYVPTSVVQCLFLYRKHAKVSGEGAPQASNISNDEIEAAKKEWADLVLTDDE